MKYHWQLLNNIANFLSIFFSVNVVYDYYYYYYYAQWDSGITLSMKDAVLLPIIYQNEEP